MSSVSCRWLFIDVRLCDDVISALTPNVRTCSISSLFLPALSFLFFFFILFFENHTWKTFHIVIWHACVTSVEFLECFHTLMLQYSDLLIFYTFEFFFGGKQASLSVVPTHHYLETSRPVVKHSFSTTQRPAACFFVVWRPSIVLVALWCPKFIKSAENRKFLKKIKKNGFCSGKNQKVNPSLFSAISVLISVMNSINPFCFLYWWCGRLSLMTVVRS